LPQVDQPPGPAEAKPKKGRLLKSLRNIFLAGVAVLLPAGITAWLIKVVGVDLLDQPARRLLARIVRLFLMDSPENPGLATEIETRWFGVGIVLTVLSIFLVGMAAKSFLGRQFLRLTEHIVNKVPLVRSVYTGIKQLSDAVFTSAGKESFNRAVLVKFMGEDAYAVGFVTGETQGEAQLLTPERVVNVFVPTTPNPTSGYLLMVPADKLIELHMTVEQALKMVISGGIVAPPVPRELLPPSGSAAKPSWSQVRQKRGKPPHAESRS